MLVPVLSSYSYTTHMLRSLLPLSRTLTFVF